MAVEKRVVEDRRLKNTCRLKNRKGIEKNVMSRKHKEGETICPIYGKAVEERYCFEECLLNDCGMLMRNHAADRQEGHAPDKKQ